VELMNLVGPVDRPTFGYPVSLRAGRLATGGLVLLESAGWTAESLVIDDPALGPDFNAPSAAVLGSDEVFFVTNEAVVRAKLGDADKNAQMRALQRLTASEATSNPGTKNLGARVSLGGDIAVLEGSWGAAPPLPWLSSSFIPYGMSAAYVFERAAGTWRFKQMLAGYGPCAVDDDGTNVACRSPSGGVDTFAHGVDGLWHRIQTLADVEYVTAIALDGDRLAVGGYGPSDSPLSLAIYERTAGTWSLAQHVLEKGSYEIDHLAVGPATVAMTCHSNEQTIAGGNVLGPAQIVRALVRSPAGAWADAGTVFLGDASDTKSMDMFLDVAVAGDRVVVLRDYELNVVGPNPADVKPSLEEFAVRGASWESTAHLPLTLPRMGPPTSIAHAGSEWLVGAPGDGTGTVTLLTRTDSGFAVGPQWTDPQAIGGVNFGSALAARDRTRLVGEPGLENAVHAAGRAHVYELVAPPR
jgi:hypothetical protein